MEKQSLDKRYPLIPAKALDGEVLRRLQTALRDHVKTVKSLDVEDEATLVEWMMKGAALCNQIEGKEQPYVRQDVHVKPAKQNEEEKRHYRIRFVVPSEHIRQAKQLLHDYYELDFFPNAKRLQQKAGEDPRSTISVYYITYTSADLLQQVWPDLIKGLIASEKMVQK